MGMANVKLPDKTLVPVMSSGLKSTPFTVVAATPAAPRLTALTSVPSVLTSLSPEILVAAFQTIGAACAAAPHSASDRAVLSTAAHAVGCLILVLLPSGFHGVPHDLPGARGRSRIKARAKLMPVDDRVAIK